METFVNILELLLLSIGPVGESVFIVKILGRSATPHCLISSEVFGGLAKLRLCAFTVLLRGGQLGCFLKLQGVRSMLYRKHWLAHDIFQDALEITILILVLNAFQDHGA